MDAELTRRKALHAIGRGGLGLVLLPGIVAGQGQQKEEKEEGQVATAEDLMREPEPTSLNLPCRFLVLMWDAKDPVSFTDRWVLPP